MRKFNMPSKGRHGPSHSTDFNWPRLLPPSGPSQSGVSYIERRSVSNPGSHHRESSALPTELRDGLCHNVPNVWSEKTSNLIALAQAVFWGEEKTSKGLICRPPTSNNCNMSRDYNIPFSTQKINIILVCI